MIQTCKRFFVHSAASSHPGALPFFVAFDAKRDHIIFHPIHFVSGKSAHPGPQKTERTFIRKILFRHSQKTPHIFYKCIEQNTFLIVEKDRYSIKLTLLFQMCGISIQITCHYRNIPITITGFPYKPPDLRRYKRSLFLWIPHHMERHRIRCIPTDRISLRRIPE